MNIKSIAVFCGSSNGSETVFKENAETLGKLISDKKIRLVFGGGNVGLMGAVSSSAVKNGGEVTGVITERISSMLKTTEGIKLHTVKGMHKRKEMMYSLADAFLIMPGGIGTLEEAFEVCTWNQLGYMNKAVCFLNINNFFDKLQIFLKEMTSQGFLKDAHCNQIKFESSPQDALETVLNYKPVYIDKL